LLPASTTARPGAGALTTVAGEEAGQPKAGEVGDPACHLSRSLRGHADAVKAHVDLQQDIEAAAGALEDLGQGEGALRTVGAYRKTSPIGEGQQPPALVLAHHRVGDEEIVEARGGEDLGLAGLGQGQPAGSRRQLHAPDLEALVGLGVGPELDAMPARLCSHASDVPLQDLEVDEDRGRFQVVEAHVPLVSLR
jgi:hypothetical protein